MTSSGLTDAEIVGLDRLGMLRLYERVLGEMILRQQQQQHPEIFSPPEEADGPPDPADADTLFPVIETLDAEELLRHYRSVSAEMMRRHRESPGIWEPDEDVGADQ